MPTTPYTSLHQNDDFGLTVSNLKYTATLAASTEETLTVPGTDPRYKLIMRAEADATVWFANNGTAAVPAGGDIEASTSEMIPVNGQLCREVKAGDVLSFITAGTNIDISLVFYAI
jgi:hypothetical protein